MGQKVGRMIIYFSTLMLVELPIIVHFRDNLNGFAVLWMLLGAVGHFFVFVILGALIGSVFNKRFETEYNAILEEYQADDDAKKFLRKLKNMKNKPKSPMMHNAYYFSLSTAYYKLGEKYGALNALNMVYTIDRTLAVEVEKQRKLIDELPEE